MPEVPEHIQDNLAHLELEVDGPNRLSGLQSPVQYSDSRHSMVSHYPNAGSGPSQLGGTHTPQHIQQPSWESSVLEQPNFSPFPRLHNPPPNVPPTDEEKEATLEQARIGVLSSNDPEMQLAWAQDALAYVEVAIQHELRISESKGGRAQSPRIEHQLRVDAVNVVSFLAEQHHPRAEFLRGMWLEFGKFGSRMDKPEAFRCYSRAAAGGYARAEYRIGMQYESSNDPEKAIRHYVKGVDAGDSASYYVRVFRQYMPSISTPT